jgi:hypothetical protein
MEDIGVPYPAVLENFLNKIHIRGAKLDIPVPRVDVDEMIRNKTIDSSGIQRLFEIFKRLSSGNRAIGISTPVSEVIPMQAKEEADLAIGEWGLEIDPIPEPDNAEILRAFDEEFALEKLVAKIKAAV